MLATLAAKNDAQERRIAALEKTVAFNESATNLLATALTKTALALFGGKSYNPWPSSAREALTKR